MKKKFREFLNKVFLIDDTPHKIAGGAALGVSLGIIPGAGPIASFALAYVFRLNRLAALAGSLIVNSWLTVVILPAAAFLGGFIFQKDYGKLVENFEESYNLGQSIVPTKIIFLDFALPLLAGFFILAAIIFCAVYFFLLEVLKRKRIEHLRDEITKKYI